MKRFTPALFALGVLALVSCDSGSEQTSAPASGEAGQPATAVAGGETVSVKVSGMA